MRQRTTAEEQPGTGQAVECRREVRLRPLRHRLDQLVRESAADHRSDLRDLLGDRAEPIEPRNQRSVQGGRDRKGRRRAACEHDGAFGAFQHRLRQLLDEQWHAIGAVDDPVDDLAREAGIAGEPLDQRCAIARAEPVQRHRGHIWLTLPDVLELGTESDDDQNRQLRSLVEGQIEQLSRGRVDPMYVFENEQNRPAPCQCFKLVQLCLEQHLTFALRAKIQVRGGIRQRRQFGQQLEFVVATRTGCQ